jgi:hypothetical protein
MSGQLTFQVAGTTERLEVSPDRLVVAGYTGRNREAVQHHIDELAQQGIAPPPTVPMFYELEPSLLTSGAAVEIPGARTSGEVEPVYARFGGRWYLGVGSDHTDRLLEQQDIHASKAACVKPVGEVLVPLPEDLLTGGFDDRVDAVTVTCWVDGSVYQEGPLTGLRPPGDVLTRLFETLGRDDVSDLVVLGGTLPLIGGAFVFGTNWRLRLVAGDGQVLEHDYSVTVTEPTA